MTGRKKSADHSYDLLVIGSGPAGESAAIAAAKAGKRVGVVENRALVGGGCAHKGTIPSKSLRHVVKQILQFKANSLFREIGDSRRLTFPRVLQSAAKVIPKQVELHTNFYVRNRVTVHMGQASFSNPNVINLAMLDGGTETIHADKIVIATGSRPYRPVDIDFNHPRIYDSDTILEMQHTPRHIIIYGAGVIGCEYASIFSGLGMRVDLINNRERLLSFLDDEISDALSYHLRDSGVTVRHGEEYEAIEASDSSVTLFLKSGKRLKADAILWCNGRSGNTDQLNLAAIGLEADHRGNLKVDAEYRTQVENIYAVGDVIGWPSLASSSYGQGRAVSGGIFGDECRPVQDVPTGIYTLPEISSVGKTETELTQAKVPYEVGRALFKNTARGQISGEDVGMLKLLFHVDTLEILGVHCFGAEAAEIVHIGQAIMTQKGEGNNIHYFLNNIFNYPTMAEAYRVAALDGINRISRR
ncbi:MULTISPECIES: Si-specific NAD(P)(+) transhydrogenase [unclassified Cellvibrio]|uniref:Si-specific NAD(P)(+) transhydrogenase n=1 Tax=unclassified Cellvibrio TaxID=2624793 RepID=UPI0012463EC7|nr:MULTISPECIES: Si-specific NAD(P)(+) transhydrogenase [unclassified Cellvibrio]QEY13376.1 Si-specific NAD(P)(+) transhydrogenase [Cellvibrio sp. KY-YJ-3]UUA73282.1 Si-specific NAD(P)(+) transhydrogenase [Cellvibrio sp. QJXJ]